MVNIIKDKEEVKSVMNIIQAFADGKTIQAIDPYDDEWCDQTKLNFEVLFYGQYRIKPEPTYKPFKDSEECWNEMQKHQPFGWIKDMDGNKFIIETVNSDGSIYVGEEGTLYFSEALENYTFNDGIPFGVKKEE